MNSQMGPSGEMRRVFWQEILSFDPSFLYSEYFSSVDGRAFLAKRIVTRLRKEHGLLMTPEILCRDPLFLSFMEYLSHKVLVQAGSLPTEYKGQVISASSPQERLYFVFQVAPSAAYNIPMAVHIQDIHPIYLEQAFKYVIERHEALRTSFMVSQQGVMQVIHPHVECGIRLFSLLASEWKAHCNAWSLQVFDLEKAPLFDARLIWLSDTKQWIFYFNIHHIIFDGGSFDVFFSELLQHYVMLKNQNQNQNQNQKMIAVAPPYRNFVEKERQYQQNMGWEDERLFWISYLDQVITQVDFPVVGNQHAVTDSNLVKYKLSANMMETVTQFSQRMKISPFSAYLSAFYVCLSHYTHQSDITIGVPLANRVDEESTNIIGFLVNTLPYRMKLPSDMSFVEFAKMTHHMALTMLSKQSVPLNEIVKWVLTDRTTGDASLFNVLFVFESGVQLSGKVEGISYEIEEIYTNTTKFVLTVMCFLSAEGLECVWEYDATRLDRQLVEHMAKDFEWFLRFLLESGDKSLSSVRLAIDSDRGNVVEKTNKTEMPLPKQTIVDAWQFRVALHANDRAIFSENCSWSYGALDNAASHVAQSILHYVGYNKTGQSLIGLYMNRSPDMIIAILAVLKAGFGYLPLYPDLPDARLSFIADHAKPVMIIVEKHTDQFHSQFSVSFKSLQESEIEYKEDKLKNVIVGKIGYVMYTSGTTGHPKGVVLSHHALFNRLMWMQNQYPVFKEDVFLMKTQFNFDVSFGEIFLPLTMGASLFVADKDGHRDPAYLLMIIQKYAVTHIHFVPSMLNIFLEIIQANSKLEVHSLKRIFCSGEALLQTTVNTVYKLFPRVELINQYGPTEAGEVSDYFCKNNEKAGIVSVGKPIWNTRFYVLDEEGRSVPPGLTGELFIAGDCLADGYLNNPETTQEAFILENNVGEALLYRTRDLVSWRSDGQLDYLGRLDKQIKLRGFRIELGELEACILSYPHITQAAVQLVKLKETDELVAYYVTQEDEVDIADLRCHLEKTLPHYMIPNLFVMLDKMPITSNGKLDTKALPIPDLSLNGYQLDSTIQQEPLTTNTQKKLANIWSQCLNIPMNLIHLSSDFFELGGHSLLLIRLLFMINTEFGCDISMKDFLQNPKLNKLSDLLDPIVTGESEDSKCSSISDELVEQLKMDQQLLATLSIHHPLLVHEDIDNTSILLTGANGFLGVHLVQYLLLTTERQIICLVRGENNDVARSRLMERFKEFSLHQCTQQSARLVVLAGDLNKPFLGLDTRVYDDLCEKVGVVIHNAAFVNHLYAYEQHRQTNVMSLAKLIHFSLTKYKKELHYISTTGTTVLEQGAESLSYETLPIELPGYLQSKWIAEYLLQKAISDYGMVCRVYRPGYIAANAKTGKIDYEHNHLSLLFLSFLQTGVAPSWREELELMPVDCLAQIIVSLVLNKQISEFAFNLSNPRTVTWNDLIEWLSENSGVSIQVISHAQWFKEYVEPATPESFLYSLKALYGREEPVNSPVPCVKKALRYDIQFPTNYEQWFSKQVQFYETIVTSPASPGMGSRFK